MENKDAQTDGRNKRDDNQRGKKAAPGTATARVFMFPTMKSIKAQNGEN